MLHARIFSREKLDMTTSFFQLNFEESRGKNNQYAHSSSVAPAFLAFT